MVTAIIIGILAGAITLMILAYFTDHEAAGSVGCIEEGQIW